MTSETLFPTWDATDLHESLTARSFVDVLELLGADIARATALFDEHDVRAVEARPVTADDGAAADQVINEYNAVALQLKHTHAFVYSYLSTNSYDESAQAAMSRVEQLGARLSPLMSRLADWVGALGAAELAGVSEVAALHHGPLTTLAARSHHQMTEPQEALFAELRSTGSGAWTRLHSDVTSQLSADVLLPNGTTERLPMASLRGLASDVDPEVRKAAYEAELAAWPTVAVTCAAAMNAIKGEAITLNRRRNWGDPLDAALFANNVSRPTFDAMHAAVLEALPAFRSWMRVKSRIHGNGDNAPLPWWDLFAPLPLAKAGIEWQDGVDAVRSAFDGFSPELGGLVSRAIDERWIDVAPRDGKVGGAFCMSFVDDRSLVLLNWRGSIDSVQTLAHELGHAFHNTRLAPRTMLQRQTPMALAETASIFCETLMVDAGLGRLSGAERLNMLDTDLQGANQVVVDIHSRFLFEQRVFDRRANRTLGVSELNELMLEAQAEAYGDGLDQTTTHPYMWAVKPHYYGSHFYNWPYTYGLLFGLGLFAEYRKDPDRFRSSYDELLSLCGMATAEQLGQRFGLDVTSQEFWTASIDILRGRMADYESLATELGV
jgi:oligoendopeptidase F